MNYIIKHKSVFIGIAIGTLAGFLYWRFIGCSSGGCAITSSPINSSLYGAVMGGLISSSFKKENKEPSPSSKEA